MKEPPAVKQILSTAIEYERMAQTIEKLGVPRVAPADQISPTTRA